MELELFDSRDLASQAAADTIAAALRRRIDAQGRASMVVSGGTSPVRCFELLSAVDLPWADVTITLSDERCVAPDHADSNARMVGETLLKGPAAAARFWPLVSGSPDDIDVDALEQSLRTLPIPFACALLGMGTDGHFASLFPDASNLADGLGTDNSRLVISVQTQASPHARLSLTLAALSRSDVIVLLIFGDEKRAVLEQAARNGNGKEQLPVAHLLRQKRAPVHVIWAP